MLGFLSVSTDRVLDGTRYERLFQSRAGFSECLDHSGIAVGSGSRRRFNPVLGFLSVSTGGEYTVIGVKSLSQCSKSNPRYVDWGCTET